MTVSNTPSGIIRISDGLVKVFSFPFKADSVATVKVSLIKSETELVDLAQNLYTVSLNAGGVGGTVNFLVAPASEQKLYIFRNTPIEQLVGVSSQQKYDPKVAEKVWDSLTLMLQEQAAKLVRAVLSAPGEDPNLVINSLLAYVEAASASASSSALSADAALASALSAEQRELSMFRPRGFWVIGTYYSPADIIYINGSSYYAVISHFAVNFAADLSAGRWFILAQNGAAGAGTGDMLNSDSLASLTNKPLAYVNLGGRAVGKVDLLPFSLIDPLAIISDVEGLAANKVPNALPTAKAVTDYVVAQAVSFAPPPIASWEFTGPIAEIVFDDLDGWDAFDIVGKISISAGELAIQVKKQDSLTWETVGYSSFHQDGGLVSTRGQHFMVSRAIVNTINFRLGFFNFAKPQETYVDGRGRATNQNIFAMLGNMQTNDVYTGLRFYNATIVGGFVEVFGVRKTYVAPPPGDLLTFNGEPVTFNGALVYFTPS